MRVYVMHFRSSGAFTSAFDSVMDARDVASCLVEPDLGRIRFLAPRKAADALVERIYVEGGLVWCSQHDLNPSNGEAGSRLRVVGDGG
jgi:hypothetical protein